MNAAGEVWLRYAKPGSLLNKTEFDAKTVALVLCLRDWCERLEDASDEFCMSQRSLTRLRNSCILGCEGTLGAKEKYPFNTHLLTDDELLLMRGVGPQGVEVIRKADGYPREPMVCLTNEEREHIEEYQPPKFFDAVEMNAQLFTLK